LFVAGLAFLGDASQFAAGLFGRWQFAAELFERLAVFFDPARVIFAEVVYKKGRNGVADGIPASALRVGQHTGANLVLVAFKNMQG